MASADLKKLRAWWAHRQGLDGTLSGADAATILARTGWSRSVGGCGPYLTLWSRARISREQADAAVAAMAIHELPSARGCTYVLPAEHYALALRVGHGFNHQTEIRSAQKLGLTAKELERLQTAVLASLKNGPLDPDGIKKKCGALVRNFGEEGKKKGLTTSLPLALGLLQSEGLIRRVPVNGRLDQQRYRYALWDPSPLKGYTKPAGECFVELARLFFRWIAPATVAEFQAFSGLGVKAARETLEALPLTPFDESGKLILADDLEAWHSYRTPRGPQYEVISSLDSLTSLRRDLAALTARPLAELGGLAELPHHAIVDRGEIVGFWEFDLPAGKLVWKSFAKPDQALRRLMAEAEVYVREQLGDARSFSLDGPKSRTARLAALRAG